MADFEEKWTMHGLGADDENCIKSCDELYALIKQVGFLPLFRNKATGFSVEERVLGDYWWTDDEERDPWCWRMELAAREDIAYGKFFEGNAGFVSKEWFPYFVALRRDGCDFDTKKDMGILKPEEIKVMACFEARKSIDARELRLSAAIGGKFDTMLTRLMMSGYVIIDGFTRRVNKKGEPYGWNMSVYATPEAKWGYELVTSAYGQPLEEIKSEIREQLKNSFPATDIEKAFKLTGV